MSHNTNRKQNKKAKLRTNNTTRNNFVDPNPDKWPNYCDVKNCEVEMLESMPVVTLSAYKSPMNTRKTYQSFNFLTEIITNNPTFTSATVLSLKIDVLDNLARCRATTNLKVSSYLENPDSSHLVINPESLYRDKILRNVVIIDGIKSVLDRFNSSDHGNHLLSNREVFENYITHANYILLLDPHLDSFCLEFIHSLRPNDRIYLVNNTLKPRIGYNIYPVSEIPKFIYDMKTALERGKKICLATTSCEFGTIVEKVLDLGGPTHRFFSTDNVDYQEIANLNPLIENLNTLFYTAAFGFNIDINVKHFDIMYVYADGKFNCAREVTLMMSRIREIKDKKICLLTT